MPFELEIITVSFEKVTAELNQFFPSGWKYQVVTAKDIKVFMCLY